ELLNISVFFFSSRRRHTRFSRDWSSDVCSSDLYHTDLFQRFIFHHIEVSSVIFQQVGIGCFTKIACYCTPPDKEVNVPVFIKIRSEERRVGKEGSTRRSP